MERESLFSRQLFAGSFHISSHRKNCDRTVLPTSAAILESKSKPAKAVLVNALAAEVARMRIKIERLEHCPWLHTSDLMSTFGISRSTLYRWIARGKLPRPSRIFGPIWRRSDLTRLDKVIRRD